MSGASGDRILQYFKKGAAIEINSDEDGFRGSWYAGTVIRQPKKISGKALVEYSTLMEDEAGKRPLREELRLVQLRPSPPRENLRTFKFSEEVDAYYNDGWWEGIITEVAAAEERYLVFFRGTREQIAFKASQLRLHREWANGKWVPPLDELSDGMSTDKVNVLSIDSDEVNVLSTDEDLSAVEKIPFSVEVEANKEVIEHNFSPGDPIEVSSDEEGLEGSWFAATVLKTINNGKYLIEYQNLMNDDGTNFLREEVDRVCMRPCPPDINLVDRFGLNEEVDAFCNDGWWVGVISKVLKNDKYSVYFKNTDETLKFEHSDLRVHQEWINGKWHTASKALNL